MNRQRFGPVQAGPYVLQASFQPSTGPRHEDIDIGDEILHLADSLEPHIGVIPGGGAVRWYFGWDGHLKLEIKVPDNVSPDWQSFRETLRVIVAGSLHDASARALNKAPDVEMQLAFNQMPALEIKVQSAAKDSPILYDMSNFGDTKGTRMSIRPYTEGFTFEAGISSGILRQVQDEVSRFISTKSRRGKTVYKDEDISWSIKNLPYYFELKGVGSYSQWFTLHWTDIAQYIHYLILLADTGRLGQELVGSFTRKNASDIWIVLVTFKLYRVVYQGSGSPQVGGSKLETGSSTASSGNITSLDEAGFGLMNDTHSVRILNATSSDESEIMRPLNSATQQDRTGEIQEIFRV